MPSSVLLLLGSTQEAVRPSISILVLHFGKRDKAYNCVGSHIDVEDTKKVLAGGLGPLELVIISNPTPCGVTSARSDPSLFSCYQARTTTGTIDKVSDHKPSK